MVPFAISAATSVRVGHAIGRMKTGLATAANVIAAGWSGIAAGAAFMLCASAVLLAFPHTIARLFTPDPGILAAAVPLLAIAAGFQFFDGIQINAAGALRGAGDTASSFYTQVFCYWVLGMPLGLYLGFHRKLGAAGLWWGLLLALVAAAAVLLWQWQRTTASLTASDLSV
jgi:MATE family multidrug resistance protein